MSIRYFIVGLQFLVVSVLANAQTLHSDSLTLDIFLEVSAFFSLLSFANH